MAAGPVGNRWRLVLLAILAATAWPAAAESGPGRASGRVTGPDDRAIDGAAVRIWSSESPTGSVAETSTGAGGEWRVIGLEPGRWQIEITARGYFPAAGWFQVLASRSEATVDVELRSLEETSPSFAENRSTVVRWIEKGNALLAQGATAEARAEYEKALQALPRDQRPEVLQAVARTHFLEGDVERSIGRLQEALGIAPESAELRRLFLTLLETAGRLEEAEALLAAAAAASEVARDAGAAAAGGALDVPAAAGAEAAGGAAEERVSAGTAAPAPGRLPLTPLVEALPGRTGRFRAIFGEHSPLSGVETYLERFELSGAELGAADPAGGAYELADESFELFVPESYAEERAHGLLVWVSPTPYGGFRNPELARVLAERRLIWIGADNAGNSRWGWYRVGLALDAVHNAKKLYSVDERRVYVAGYSGGGRVASQLAMLYPEIFAGGLFAYGCDWFEPLPVPDRPGSLWPARFAAPPAAVRERLESESRFVLLTGERDFNRSQTKQIHKRMLESGFERLTYLQIPGADHYFGLPAEWLERGLAGLDGPLEAGERELGSQ